MSVTYIQEKTTTNEPWRRSSILERVLEPRNLRREPKVISSREAASAAVPYTIGSQTLDYLERALQAVKPYQYSEEAKRVRDSKTTTERALYSPIAVTPGESLISGRLRRLAALEADWDSYGAQPVSSNSLVTAERTLTLIRSIVGGLVSSVEPSMLAARADGGILAEWIGSEGSIEIHFEPNGSMGYLLEEGGTGAYSEVDSASLGAIIKALLTTLSE